MAIFIIIGSVIFFFFILLGNKKLIKHKLPYPQINTPTESKKEIQDISNIKMEVFTSILPSLSDDSIIDVTNYSYNNNFTDSLKKHASGIPYWEHHYVYSCSELENASDEQKQFYFLFKKFFLNGEYLDLEGNTNYAFILLFNLLEEYENHKDIIRLEKQLKKLGQYYSKTKSYCNSFLIKKMNLLGYDEGIARIQEEQTYNQYWWKLGYKYKDKLNLKKEEINFLNDLQYSTNSFNNIEFCMIEILKLYMATCNNLKSTYIKEQTTIEKEFETVVNIIIQNHVTGYYYYSKESVINSIYAHIFRCCENSVREYYRYRKLNVELDYYYSEKAKKEYEERISSKVMLIISGLIKQLVFHSEDIERQLYTQNTSRWKYRYKEIIKNYNSDNKRFFDEIIKLSELNKFNQQGVEELFYEATKFILKYDNETSIKLYFYYFATAISNHRILTNKRLMTLIVERNLDEALKLLKKEYPIVSKLYKFNLFLLEKLFKTDEQRINFEKLFESFLSYKNVDDAISKIPSIYRKKIKLNDNSILEVQEQYSETVELLNEYLKDEYEVYIKPEISEEKIKVEIIPSVEYTNIEFTPIHTATLNLFRKNKFSVLQGEIEVFAKSNGILKNQLIENINEICYDFLDDVLIEEDGDYYTIIPDYQKIIEK
jgi:hypothetical protein